MGKSNNDTGIREMKKVIVTMSDFFTGEIVKREICASNATRNRPRPTLEQIEENLNEWITKRAEVQHDTSFNLVSWEMVTY